MKKLETYELTHLYKQLKQLSKSDMTGSGIRLLVTGLDGHCIGEMDFIGELLPELIPVLCKSLEDSLSLRAARAKDDLAKINLALAPL